MSITTRTMFGGLAVMWGANMLVGIVHDDLMVRVGRDQLETLLNEPGAREMDFTGRPSRTMLYVRAEAVERDADLDRWVARARQFVATLPPR
jgi:TfoX/Sxy family transcriptional regulator of competence genes